MSDEVCYTSAPGSYVLDGYDSIIRFAPMFQQDGLVCIELLRISFIAALQTPPSDLQLRLGVSGQIADPNTAECGLQWIEHERRPLKCLADPNRKNYVKHGTEPAQLAEWAMWRPARVIYGELKISGTGGDATFTGVLAKVQGMIAENY